MVACSVQQSVIWRDGDIICLRLLRRKNRMHGSGVMQRQCTCKGGIHTCVVHCLWEGFFQHLSVEERPWSHITAGTARERLRRILARLRIPNAAQYRTQDFRRGHAEAGLHGLLARGRLPLTACQDLRRAGSALAEILKAGQWKSAAFLRYIDELGLEKAA